MESSTEGTNMYNAYIYILSYPNLGETTACNSTKSVNKYRLYLTPKNRIKRCVANFNVIHIRPT